MDDFWTNLEGAFGQSMQMPTAPLPQQMDMTQGLAGLMRQQPQGGPSMTQGLGQVVAQNPQQAPQAATPQEQLFSDRQRAEYRGQLEGGLMQFGHAFDGMGDKVTLLPHPYSGPGFQPNLEGFGGLRNLFSLLSQGGR